MASKKTLIENSKDRICSQYYSGEIQYPEIPDSMAIGQFKKHMRGIIPMNHHMRYYRIGKDPFV